MYRHAEQGPWHGLGDLTYREFEADAVQLLFRAVGRGGVLLVLLVLSVGRSVVEGSVRCGEGSGVSEGEDEVRAQFSSYSTNEPLDSVDQCMVMVTVMVLVMAEKEHLNSDMNVISSLMLLLLPSSPLETNPSHWHAVGKRIKAFKTQPVRLRNIATCPARLSLRSRVQLALGTRIGPPPPPYYPSLNCQNLRCTCNPLANEMT